MNIERLQDLYINNIERIFTPENFRELASHSNNIQGYSFINRALMYMQNKFCTEAKSEITWQLEGREVNNGAVPIGIITPVIKTKYIDTDSGAEIKVTELSDAEFNKGVLLGIFHREITIQDVKCTLIYDIRDTVEQVKKADKADKADRGNRSNRSNRKIKLSTLLELLESIGVVVNKVDSEHTAYDITDNTLYVGEDGLTSKIKACLETVGVKYIEQCETSTPLGESEKRLVKDYILYSVLTYFNIDINIEFEYITDVYSEDIENIIEILDDIEYMLNSNILNGENISGYAVDEGHRTYIAHRAVILLDILEANYGNKRC